MSGKGGVSSASSVDLSLRDFFNYGVLYAYCQGKSVQECFQSLKHCLGDQSPHQSHCYQMVQTVHVWSGNVGRR